MANNDLVGAVVKAMALVKLVASSPDGMRHNELAEAANLKTVTCFNLVRTLIAGGFLEKIDGKLYIGHEISRLSVNRFHT
ncbi:MAG: helix-turn-helix domain-containing protein, partial [Lentisphaeria bacterium]|nr:helix-turn-helix domain-containing protein [Lentisphaeria bacterium]